MYVFVLYCTLYTTGHTQLLYVTHYQWLKWKSMQRWVTVHLGFGPLLVAAGPYWRFWTPSAPDGGRGPETTELTSLPSNHAFTFTSLTWILSRKNGKTVQKFNAQYAEMRLLAYRSVPLSVPCVFWKLEVRERLGLKIGGGGTALSCVHGTLTTARYWLTG